MSAIYKAKRKNMIADFNDGIVDTLFLARKYNFSTVRIEYILMKNRKKIIDKKAEIIEPTIRSMINSKPVYLILSDIKKVHPNMFISRNDINYTIDKYNLRPTLTKDKVIALHKEGISNIEISKRFNISRQYVSRTILEEENR